jgi:hypothetical protein
MTHHVTHHDAEPYRRSPTATALVHAVAAEMQHLACAASLGELDGLVPLAIPHEPLLANLHALRRDLTAGHRHPGDRVPRTITFIPIAPMSTQVPAHLPLRNAAERIARATERRAEPGSMQLVTGRLSRQPSRTGSRLGIRSQPSSASEETR